MNVIPPIQTLLDFIDASPSPWHVVDTLKHQLKPYKFIELQETETWQLKPGGRYFVIRDGSSIVLFMLGRKPLLETGLKLVGAHTDSPSLRLKPNPSNHKDHLVRLNVEIYGSPILATFADRDLSLAGRICYVNEQHQISTRLIRFDTPLIRLPNLAIHMNRGVNEDGLKLHKQNELALILSQVTEKDLPPEYFLNLLKGTFSIESNRILSWDLNVYDTQKGALWGSQNEFFCDSQLDNLASCHAGLQAILNDKVLDGDNTVVCAFFDHEEIGSESKQGADGSFLSDCLQRISFCTGNDSETTARIMAKSFLVSADMAHAYQPNFPAAYDHDHKVYVNQGPVIKFNANQRYSSESISEAMFINWCQQADVPFQRYSHRCDLPCGSTIGPITSARLGIRSIDVGNPMWAMHSIRESAGVHDHYHMIKVLTTFFIS
jgi:aspartyl aminopeptidase